MNRKLFIGLVIATMFIIRPVAAQKFDYVEFMATVACHSLPTGACELLNVDTARGIALTYRSLLTTRFCGTPNFNAARQLLELGDATSPRECETLLAMIGGSGAAPAPKSTGCAAGQILVTPNNHCITRARLESWKNCQMNCSKKVTKCPSADARYMSSGNWDVFAKECADEMFSQIDKCKLTNCGSL